MTIYIIYAIIILVTIILYFLIKDKKEFLNKIGTITLTAGFITLILGLVLNIALNNFFSDFNIIKITTLLLNKFIYNSIFLLTLGVIEILISKLIQKKKKSSS